MGDLVESNHLDNKRLTAEQMVLLDGERVICTGCGRVLFVSPSERLVVLCGCGCGWGRDGKGLFVIERDQGQGIWDDHAYNTQN